MRIRAFVSEMLGGGRTIDVPRDLPQDGGDNHVGGPSDAEGLMLSPGGTLPGGDRDHDHDCNFLD